MNTNEATNVSDVRKAKPTDEVAASQTDTEKQAELAGDTYPEGNASTNTSEGSGKQSIYDLLEAEIMQSDG